MKTVLLACSWLGTLAAAFLIGRGTPSESGAEPATVPPPREAPVEPPPWPEC